VLESGVVLNGPSPATFVPEINSEMFFEALEREVSYLREEIITKPNSEWRDVPFYRAYAVLTLCRILYSFEKRRIVSKPRAARWTIRHFPGKWDQIIHQALLNDDHRHSKISLPGLKQFIDFVDDHLHRNPSTLETV
jgi:hypothetical protein